MRNAKSIRRKRINDGPIHDGQHVVPRSAATTRTKRVAGHGTSSAPAKVYRPSFSSLKGEKEKPRSPQNVQHMSSFSFAKLSPSGVRKLLVNGKEQSYPAPDSSFQPGTPPGRVHHASAVPSKGARHGLNRYRRPRRSQGTSFHAHGG